MRLILFVVLVLINAWPKYLEIDGEYMSIKTLTSLSDSTNDSSELF